MNRRFPAVTPAQRTRVGVSGRWLVIALLVALAAYQFLFPGFSSRILVTDAVSGRPLPGVRIATAGANQLSDAAGGVELGQLRPNDEISFQIDGYEGAQRRFWPWEPPLAVALIPRSAEIAVVDAESGEPIPDAQVLVEGATVAPTSEGRFLVSPARPGLTLRGQAPGYMQGQQAYGGAQTEKMTLKPRLNGVVTDAVSGRPISGALVFAGEQRVVADAHGAFELRQRPSGGTLRVLAPGYLRGDLDLAARPTSYDVALQPIEVRGLYLTFQAIGYEELREHAFDLLETTSLNAVVIDVKGDRGYLAYPSTVPLADKIGANQNHTIEDAGALLKRLKGMGVYTIARIVVFKDDQLARRGAAAGVDVAIKNGQTEQPWIDGEGLAWVDPFEEQAWDYNIALAREAAEHGFDEVQFDYIRFPTDPASGSRVEAARYSREPTEQERVKAINAFLARARPAINAAGAYLSVDTFGYTAWADDDMGIGQHLPSMAPHVDYVCPMVYPSTFNAGLPGGMPYPDIIRDPYRVIYDSMVKAHQKLEGKGAVLRPWLQYFDDYPWQTAYPYQKAQIEAQVNAARDSKTGGYMLWDPTNLYEHGGIGRK